MQCVQDSELLQFIINNGIININDIQNSMEAMKRKELLEKHPYKIWQGKDGKWYTYIPDGEGRRLKKRITQELIEDDVIEYWRTQAENPTIKEVFEEWNDRRLMLDKISNATHLRNKQIFNRHYKSFGMKRIKNVTLEEFEEFLEEQIPEHQLTAKAFSNLKTVTRGFLKRARKRKLLTFSSDELFQELVSAD